MDAEGKLFKILSRKYREPADPELPFHVARAEKQLENKNLVDFSRKDKLREAKLERVKIGLEPVDTLEGKKASFNRRLKQFKSTLK